MAVINSMMPVNLGKFCIPLDEGAITDSWIQVWNEMLLFVQGEGFFAELGRQVELSIGAFIWDIDCVFTIAFFQHVEGQFGQFSFVFT